MTNLDGMPKWARDWLEARNAITRAGLVKVLEYDEGGAAIALDQIQVSLLRDACLREWAAVNDPPCHPSDAGWSGCSLCGVRLVRAMMKSEGARPPSPNRDADEPPPSF